MVCDPFNSSSLNMEAVGSSETLVRMYQTKRRYITKDHVNTHRSENFKSHSNECFSVTILGYHADNY
jgi:hypothetical protein